MLILSIIAFLSVAIATVAIPWALRSGMGRQPPQVGVDVLSLK